MAGIVSAVMPAGTRFRLCYSNLSSAGESGPKEEYGSKPHLIVAQRFTDYHEARSVQA